MLNSTEPDHAPQSARGGLVSIPRRLGCIGIAAWHSNEPSAASSCVCGYVLVRSSKTGSSERRRTASRGGQGRIRSGPPHLKESRQTSRRIPDLKPSQATTTTKANKAMPRVVGVMWAIKWGGFGGKPALPALLLSAQHITYTTGHLGRPIR